MLNRKDIDNNRLAYHPQRVAQWLREGDCFPLYVEIGPTEKCNHRCTFCALDWLNKEAKTINSDIMFKTLENMAQSGVKSIMFAGEGEPLMHEDIKYFIEKAKLSGLDVSLTSNGVLFDKEIAEYTLPHLSWVRFSIDAGTPETYSKIHHTKPQDFQTVFNNIKFASEFSKKNNLQNNISAQFLLIPENDNEVIRFTELAKVNGANNVQIKPYSQHPNSINQITFNYKHSSSLEEYLKKFEDNDFKVFFRKETMNRLDNFPKYGSCHGLPFFALINAKGDIIPCNLFYDNPDFIYGNLYKNSFSEIWQSNQRKEVIRKISEKGIEECRKGCRLDSNNIYLERLKCPQPYDNFI